VNLTSQEQSEKVFIVLLKMGGQSSRGQLCNPLILIGNPKSASLQRSHLATGFECSAAGKDHILMPRIEPRRLAGKVHFALRAGKVHFALPGWQGSHRALARGVESFYLIAAMFGLALLQGEAALRDPGGGVFPAGIMDAVFSTETMASTLGQRPGMAVRHLGQLFLALYRIRPDRLGAGHRASVSPLNPPEASYRLWRMGKAALASPGADLKRTAAHQMCSEAMLRTRHKVLCRMLETTSGPNKCLIWLQELRALAVLSWPLALTNLAQIGMSATDVMMMGWLGPDTLAAGALGANLYFVTLIFGIGLFNATTPMIARELGRSSPMVCDVLVGRLLGDTLLARAVVE
jgi:MatE